MSDIENEESQKEETDTDNPEEILNTDDNDTDGVIEKQDELNETKSVNENDDKLKINEIVTENLDRVKDDEVINKEDSNLEDDAEENKSIRSIKSHLSKSSKMSGVLKERFLELESLEALPSGCVPLFLSGPTLALFKIVLDDTVSAQRPLVHIAKDDILADLTARAAVSDFSVLKTQLRSYDGTDIVLAYDPAFKFGENFVFATSEVAKAELLKTLIVEVTEDDDDEEDEKKDSKSPGQAMLTGDYVPGTARPWTCLGSDLEILESQVVNSRPLIRTAIQRPRRQFGTEITFAPTKISPVVEVRHYEDSSFSLRVLERDRGESNAPQLRTMSTNTDWPQPRNAHTQYESRQLTASESESLCQAISGRTVMPYLVQALQQNEAADYFLDDYRALAPGDNVFDAKTDQDLREFQTFADLRVGKEKAVVEVQWHPTIKGIVAAAMTEKTSFDARVDGLPRTILAKSYILLWSFLDPIQPQLLLEAPADILCFKFNPTDPQFVAGGCVNGQIVLWDIERCVDDLKNVKARIKLRNVVPLFSFDNDNEPKIPTIRYCAVSHCESSHAAPITDLKWLPDHYEINNLGYSLENLTQKCVQIATAAGDNKILFWDIRVNKAFTGLPDKAASAIPTPAGVPDTFRYLDMKWKPTLRVHVYKSSPGGDYNPTKFSLKEVQGDRRVLDSLEDKENKLDDVIKAGAQKGRTLQAVNTHIFVGTEDGELVYVDWMPQKDSDTGKLQTTKPDHFWSIHDGSVSCVTRCPFDRSLILVVGGWIWSLWKEEVTSGPILQSCTSAKPLTNGTWSPTKASVFFLTRADGRIEIWDILDKTHEPTLIQNISSSTALTSISIHNFVKKQLVAIGDINGGLHVYEIPPRFKQHTPGELIDCGKYIDREVKRRDFVSRRWNLREQEKIEKEIENKKKAGIAPQVNLSEDEIRVRMKAEYDAFCQEEQVFLRELGLKEDEEEL